MFDDAGNDVALALDCADDADLSRSRCRQLPPLALVPMLVLVLPADVGFVNLDDASELVGLVFAEAGADAVAHVERGFVGAEAHVRA